MATVIHAICSNAYWGTPTWAGKVSEVARDAYYTGQYTTPALWETGRDGVAQAADTERGEIVGTWSADTNIFEFSGGDTSVIWELVALGDARCNGAPAGANAYRLETSSGTHLVKISVPNVTLDGFRLNNTVTSDAGSYCILADNANSTGIIISNMMLALAGDGNGIYLDNAAVTIKIYCTVVYGSGSQSGSSEGIYSHSALNTSLGVEIYNCIVRNFNDGIERDLGFVNVINCAIFDNADDMDGTFNLTDYCFTDDNDGTNSQTGLTIANEFTDEGNHDYSLQVGSTLEDTGTDDPGSGLYSVDIAGVTFTANWPIGAFEDTVAGGISIPLLLQQMNQFNGGQPTL